MAPRRRNSSQQQQQQPAQPGAVYGPRSALTSFLREQGITGATASQFRPRTGQRLDTPQTTPVQDQGDQAGAGADPTAANADAGPSTSSSSTSTPVTTTAAAKKRKHEKPEGVDEDGFRLGGSQLPAPAPKKGRYEHRPVGSFAVCAECGKKFTVSKYTASNPNAEVGGVLCQPCTSESIEERASFPGAAGGAGASGASTPNKRPKVQKKKSQRGVDETLFTPIPTLQQACLALVSQYIHSVEALGDLGPKNLDKVSKIVAKNRALDDLNLKLFLDVGHREIKLYDCTKITDRALASISTFAPHLTHLTLLQCGRLDDDVLTAWSHPLTGFKELRHLTLYAPYLVRAEKWKEFFEGIGGADEQGEEEGVVTKKRPEVETFQLRMSSRFNDEALAAFVKHNPHVVHLQLSELGKLTSSSLSLLHPLARSSTTIAPSSSSSSSDSVPMLRTLDLSRLGTPQGQVLVDKDLIALLATGLGAGLERLVLDGNALLTERSLTEGVRRYCHRLRELSLSDCDGIKGEGVEAMFTGRWPGEEEEEEEVGGDEGDVAMKGVEAEDGGQQNGGGGGGGAAGNATASTSAAGSAAVTAVVVDGDDQANNKDGAEHSQHGAEPDATATAAADDADEEEDLPLFEPGRPWRSPGLTLLNLHRLTTVNPPTLSALMAHSAHSLEYLNLHSCDELDANSLMDTLAQRAKKVQVLDLSFVRAVDNFVVQRLLDKCGGLRVLFLHGNNRVTSDVPRKRGVHLRGLENAFYSEVPAGVPWEQ